MQFYEKRSYEKRSYEKHSFMKNAVMKTQFNKIAVLYIKSRFFVDDKKCWLINAFLEIKFNGSNC
jgi:hypothetical protein